MPYRIAALAAVTALAGCGDDLTHHETRAVFDLASAHDTPATFYDLPFPSDLRLTADGTPDMTGFYRATAGSVGAALADAAMERRGWPQLPVTYVRFDGPLAPRSADDVIPADAGAPIVLVDIDEDSDERGMLRPLVAATLEEDEFAPAHLLAVAPRPGFVLRGGTTYALVVRRDLGDAAGDRLGVPDDLAALVDGGGGDQAAALYAPLWPALAELGVSPDDVAAATVFTTGDVVADVAAMTDALLERHEATLSAPSLDGDGVHDDYCELSLEFTLPQFLTGEEPWNDGGRFELDADGVPEMQGALTVPAVITIPREPMPAGGYPLFLYFHGSGGVHDEVVDASRSPETGVDGPQGEGPAMYFARIGFAAAGAALPVSPDRVPGASETAYINFQNLSVFPFLFQQGVIEQRMFLTALGELAIPVAELAGCGGVATDGDGPIVFDPEQIYAGGQSMGGMYTNMFGAVDPRPRALVPTGAGGMWSLMILTSRQFADMVDLLGILLGTQAELSFLHPGMHSLEIAWETAEPLVYVPRLARDPLPGRPSRPVYQPVGRDDKYFATPVYDAMALAYGHQQAGDEVWPEMQDALALAGLDGVQAYPVAGNLTAPDGEPYTGVVVQYEGDGIADPHSIYRQLDEVIYQYSCFLETMRESGEAVVPAPAPLGTPCP
ncbi:MAG TPA: hypothetical protein VMZ28_14460 [Kofleriaceae bacterium]|nr:hypothetical protein [Kofleriaceae bacterium]